jgi:hypothetical protein
VAAFVNHVPTFLNPPQVGVQFIDVVGICHWSLLPPIIRGKSRHRDELAQTHRALFVFLTHEVVKKTSLCWALYVTYVRPIEIVIRSNFYFSIFMSVKLTLSLEHFQESTAFAQPCSNVSADKRAYVRFGSLAEILQRGSHVRFTLKPSFVSAVRRQW